MTQFRHVVTSEDDGMEVRQITRQYFDFSARLRNRIKREKLTMRNGEYAEGWHRVREGDVITITLPDEHSNFPAEDIPIDIIYEDDDLMVINKKPGIVVHPTKGHPSGTCANALSNYMEETGRIFKIRFVNRLDRDTSGLLIVAKNAYCQNHITDQMRNGRIHKRYIAIVNGEIPSESGTVDLPIGRPDPEDVRRGVMSKGAPSVTHYEVIKHLKDHTLIELLLETGRTHQIRVHMSHIGHPVTGDTLYGDEEPDVIGRQALHAAKLSLIHPIKKEPLELEAPLPDDMKTAIEELSHRLSR
ncbi:MAG: RluA family pseudouridine synthase [Bacillota bacterium]